MGNDEHENLPARVRDFLIYNSPQGDVRVAVRLFDDTIWLTQQEIAELFGADRSVVTKHLGNVFADGELVEDVVVSVLEGATSNNRHYQTKYYNLDAIIAVGYRVNSVRATQFRIWATQTLREFIIKGFALDDERLKQGHHFGRDYFDELLERVRSIRASERRIYQKITDIFAECSIDYARHSATTQEFYATVQNKFHFAITGKTAAEIVHSNADRNKPKMGLTTWKNAPSGRILKSDTLVAKNYLTAREIARLERSVGAFFDYIENQIEQRQPFTMARFASAVNRFLEFNDFEVLENKGRVSHEQAQKKAFAEYKEFNKTQKIESDFDKEVKKALRTKKTGDD